MDFYETDGGRINPKSKDDCVVRSISIASRKPYREVFTDLMTRGLDLGLYPNDNANWQGYLADLGWVKNKPPRDGSGKLIKLANWDFKGRAVVINSRHLTAVDGGTVCDTWDCRYRPVNSYWTPNPSQ